MTELTRFGVAMESSLLAQLDQLVRDRKTTRSELFRDLARAEITKALARRRVDAFATVTLVYDHHVRDLTERLMEMQHELGQQVHSTMHVHLDHDRCLEVIVMRGRADRLQDAAEKLFATRGVLRGAIEVVAADEAHGGHAHGHDVEHAHTHAHSHAHRAPPQARPKKKARGGSDRRRRA